MMAKFHPNRQALAKLASDFGAQFPQHMRRKARSRAMGCMVDKVIDQMKPTQLRQFKKMWVKILDDIAAKQAPDAHRRDRLRKAHAIAALAAQAGTQNITTLGKF